ncbi:hypothetical protein DdX_14061 [Ditylenchus destructor]|uniref:Uncharacterized protein n=1 Tax=Ditylenchus destructor TaxID=166010 RepID=A0AAD4MRQ9_9BILA|nr:hypothetical protein DdX_14061 [Ditylenchus destructor]
MLLFSRILFLYAFRRGSSFRVSELSGCMISYLSNNVLAMAIYACTYLIMIIRRLTPNAIKEVDLWVQNLASIEFETLCLTVFFLALERCLVVLLGLKFTPRIKSVLLVANIIYNPGILIVGCFVVYDDVALYVLWGIKLAVGLLNTCLYAFLVWKIKTTGISINDAIVRNTTILDICLDMVPNILEFVAEQLDADRIIGTNYIWYGSLPFLTQSINVAICGIIYNRSLLSDKQSQKVIAVSSPRTTLTTKQH